MRVRAAEPADVDPVVAFTRETWADRREGGDYLPEVFRDWVASTDDDRRTVVAERDGEVVGCLQAVCLSAWEGWLQGLRVAPSARGEGVGTALVEDGFAWARDSGATVARAMVFSWNEMGLGLSRAAGLDPATEFRWVHPEPDPAADGEDRSAVAPDAAWAFWTGAAARDHLRGLALAPAESWAVASLTRTSLSEGADRGGLLGVRDDHVRGFAVHTRTVDRDDGREAVYGVAAWADRDACKAVLDAVAADAAARGADRTRVLVPETTRAVTDAAACRVAVADAPDFVVAADLT